MRNLLFALFAFIVSLNGVFAQDADAKEAFDRFSTELLRLDSISGSYVGRHDYANAERVCGDMIGLYNSQSESIQQQCLPYAAYIYYNLTCYQSLQNKLEEAIASFGKASQAGYSDFRHAAVDSDLDNIRSDQRFQQILSEIQDKYDYHRIIRQAPEYSKNTATDTLPTFRYTAATDSSLAMVRHYFNLDSIAGDGDEISKIKNLLAFVHDNIRHDGMHGNPQPFNAINLYEVCKDGSRGLNCRGLAMLLNEMYLSIGIKSRYITCYPRVDNGDCHVINAVYSTSLDSWLWVDPTWNALVYDENDRPLSVAQVRERIIDGRPLRLHDDANWNNSKKASIDNYLYSYMAKNLYYIQACDLYTFGTESLPRDQVSYILLSPTGLVPDYPTSSTLIVHDDTWFWQSPK